MRRSNLISRLSISLSLSFWNAHSSPSGLALIAPISFFSTWSARNLMPFKLNLGGFCVWSQRSPAPCSSLRDESNRYRPDAPAAPRQGLPHDVRQGVQHCRNVSLCQRTAFLNPTSQFGSAGRAVPADARMKYLFFPLFVFRFRSSYQSNKIAIVQCLLVVVQYVRAYAEPMQVTYFIRKSFGKKRLTAINSSAYGRQTIASWP